MMVLVPDWVVVLPAVKFEVLALIEPVPVTVTAPVKVTEPVVLQVSVPAMAEVPETARVLAPVKSRVEPAFTVRFVIVVADAKVTLLATVTVAMETAEGPLMVWVLVEKVVAPVPVMVKEPLLVIPFLN